MFETENIFKVAQFHWISTAKNIVPKIIFIYLESHCIFKDVLHDVWADTIPEYRSVFSLRTMD